MQGKNRYFRRSHLSEAKFRALIRYFAHDLPAWKIAELSGVSRPTINQLFMKLRIRIAQVCNASSPLSGEGEVDESYFGARRVRGKKRRGVGGKPIVFGILERHGKVSEIVPDASRKHLQSAILDQAALEASSTRTAGEATMGWWTWATKSISGCIMVSMSLPAVIAISMALESFWSYAKRRLAKFNAVPRQTFLLHIKECEFRFHHREEDLSDRILTLLKENSL